MSSANPAESPEALRAEVESLKAQLAAKKAELRLRKKQQPASSEGSTRAVFMTQGRRGRM